MVSEYNKLQTVDWGFQININRKGYPIAKRVWDTKADMMAYLQDPDSSAVPGIILVVVKDTEENNGAYIVKRAAGIEGYKAADIIEDLAIVKLANGNVQNLTIAEGSAEGVKIEDDKLTIPDMRTYWDEKSF